MGWASGAPSFAISEALNLPPLRRVKIAEIFLLLQGWRPLLPEEDLSLEGAGTK